MGRIPMTSSASISSLMRIAPSCAVAPAPMVAANAMAAVNGVTSRVLTNADANPISASTPISESWLKPWVTSVPAVDMVRKPMTATVPPMTASAPVPKLIAAT